MTKDKATDIIVSRLALDSFDHIEAAKKIPSLVENTTDACTQNQEAAAVFGIEDKYLRSLSQLING
jgi:hypothetical protein